MAKPATITWATGGAATVTNPGTAKRDLGWILGEKPAHDEMNWIQNGFGQWTQYIGRQFSDTFVGAPGEASLILGSSGGLTVSQSDGVVHKLTHFDDGGGDPWFKTYDLEVENKIRNGLTVETGLLVEGDIDSTGSIEATTFLAGTTCVLDGEVNLAPTTTGGHRRLVVADPGLTLPAEVKTEFFRPGASQPTLNADFPTTLSQANMPKLCGYFQWDDTGASGGEWVLINGYNIDSIVADATHPSLVFNVKDGLTEPLFLSTTPFDLRLGKQTTDVWAEYEPRISLDSVGVIRVDIYNKSGTGSPGALSAKADFGPVSGQQVYGLYVYGM